MTDLMALGRRLHSFRLKALELEFSEPTLAVLAVETCEALEAVIVELGRVQGEQMSQSEHLGELESRVEDLEEPDM